MHLTIISGAARPQSRSNTARIIEAFSEGIHAGGHTTEVWYLSDRRQWEQARSAFEKNENILFALPLYVENIPGLMLEFLEGLSPKEKPGTKIAFLIQGGFPEASQSRCCERFLKTLPQQLNCAHAGTLIRGNMFGVRLLGKKLGGRLVQPFTDMGRLFAEYGEFRPEIVSSFAGPEYLPEKQLRQMGGMGNYIQRWSMGIVARRLGCREKLDAKPYHEVSPVQRD